jgi:hypothetical protein
MIYAPHPPYFNQWRSQIPAQEFNHKTEIKKKP